MKVKTLVKIHIFEFKNTRLLDRKNHIAYFLHSFGNSHLDNLKTSVLFDWLTEYKAKNNFTEKNMCHIKCQLNYFFKWLFIRNLTDCNLIESIKFKQNLPPKKPRVILSENELKKLLISTNKNSPKVLYPFLYTLIQTGARRSEVVNLCWKDIDFETNRITFRQTKNGESRSITMPNGLRLMLKNKNKNSFNNEFVFKNKKGDKLHRQQIHRMISKLKEKTPISGKDWGCHALRHSFAYNFLKKGGEMYQLKAILGHKTISMTVDLYGNLKSHDISNPSPYDF